MKHRKLFLILSLLLVAALVLGACGGGGDEAPTEEPAAADFSSRQAGLPQIFFLLQVGPLARSRFGMPRASKIGALQTGFPL